MNPRFKLTTKEELARSQVEYEHKNTWQDHWIDTIRQAKTVRFQKEEQLRLEGYTIDESYQDPIVHQIIQLSLIKYNLIT